MSSNETWQMVGLRSLASSLARASRWFGSPRIARGLAAMAACALVLALVPSSSRAGEDHSGRYVMLQQTTVISKVPVVADLVSTTRAISVQTLRQKGDRLVGSGPVCHIDIENSSSMVRTELPAAFRRALPPVKTDAHLETQGDMLTFRQAPQTLVMGAKLKNPRTDPLPTSPNDSRVIDEDGDGKPGVTVRVKGIVSGEVYVAQRSVSSLRGGKKGKAFTGRIDFKTEDRILDATSKMLTNRTETRPDPKRSFFRMEQVPDSFSCADAQKLAAGWR